MNILRVLIPFLVVLVSMLFPNLLSTTNIETSNAFLGALLGGLGAGVISGAFGLGGEAMAASESRKAAAKAELLRKQALGILSGVDPTQLPELTYTPEELQYMAGEQPLMYQGVGPVEAKTVQDNPELRAIQMQALNEMRQRAEEGMTAKERADWMRSRKQTEEAARGREGAIIENLQARGMSGSGMEAALRQMSAQAAAERMSQEGADRQALMAQQSALANLQQQQMAQGMRAQDIGLSQSNADILNKFAMDNSARAQAIKNMNVQLQNQAKQQELAAQRGVQESNVAARNQAELMRQQAGIEAERVRQQSAQNIASQKAGALTGQIPSIMQAGAAKAEAARAPWQALSQIPGAAYGAYQGAQQLGMQQQQMQNQRDYQQGMIELQRQQLYSQPITGTNYYSAYPEAMVG